MKYKHLAFTLGAILTSTIILLFSCRKINEATLLGGDLIPPVDNINTFDTTLEVRAFNDTFSLLTDSTRYSGNAIHFVGQINNDPFFGTTDAQMALQLKPTSYKFYFANRPDSLHIDSVVLVLDYVDTWGDTLVPQTVNVYEVAQASEFKFDSTYLVRVNPVIKGALLGSRTVIPATLNDSVKAYQDTTIGQLRIRLDDTFGQRLLAYDSSSNAGPSGAYASDSAFNTNFKGFALEAVGGNALMGFDLTGANTKLAIYYKDDNGDKPVAEWDTLVTYFKFSNKPTFVTDPASASSQYVKRDYSGTPLEASIDGTTTPDNLVYIQNAPGTFATVQIPGLANLSNRIVHRAELIMEQAYDITDSTFPPSLLYVDAFDPTIPGYRTIPYDLLFDNFGNLALSSFGVAPTNVLDGSGHVVKIWRINLSRYIQNVVNKNEPALDLRVSSPYYYYETYKPTAQSTSSFQTITINNTVGPGRVRLHGGDESGVNPRRMRLRVIYSKI